jgi:hypothetical protein
MLVRIAQRLGVLFMENWVVDQFEFKLVHYVCREYTNRMGV